MDGCDHSSYQKASNMPNNTKYSNLISLTTRSLPLLERSKFNDESCPTASSEEQTQVEKNCLKMYKIYNSRDSELSLSQKNLMLERDKTIKFLKKGLLNLSE